MLNTSVYDCINEYKFIVTDGIETYEYNFRKEPPEGQILEEYLQNCKREAELLAQYDIDRNAPPQEIIV